ncbi:MAG: pilus assembly protein PilM [Lentisphaerae bacterium]|nr:pilus assembly protein PilM [Lentisphaerota bacterium]
MKFPLHIFRKLKRGPTDVLGVDIGASNIKLVRMSGGSNTITVTGAGLLPTAAPSAPGNTTDGPLDVPPLLRARHASLAVTASDAVIKLLTFPGHFDENQADRIFASLALQDEAAYRVSYRIVTQGTTKTESRVLAVAAPQADARRAVGLFPGGQPVPFSLEISGLAAMTAFLHTPAGGTEDPVGVLDFGASVSTFAIINRGSLSLVRRLDTGMHELLDKIGASLGVDRETATHVLADKSFDVSRPVTGVMAPLLKQLILSRDFIERRENCRIERLILCGGIAQSRDAMNELRSTLDIETAVLDPFDGHATAPGALTDEVKSAPWRYAAAAGACLATLEEAREA